LFGLAASLLDSSVHWIDEWLALRADLGFQFDVSQPFFTVSRDTSGNYIAIDRSAACGWFRDLLNRSNDKSIGLHSLKKALLSKLASSDCSHFSWQLAAYHKTSDSKLFGAYGHDLVSRPLRALELVLTEHLGIASSSTELASEEQPERAEQFSESEQSSDDDEDFGGEVSTKTTGRRTKASKLPRVDSALTPRLLHATPKPFPRNSGQECGRQRLVSDEGEEEEEVQDDESEEEVQAGDFAQHCTSAGPSSLSLPSSSSSSSVPPSSSSSSSQPSTDAATHLSRSLPSSSSTLSSAESVERVSQTTHAVALPHVPQYNTRDQRESKRRKLGELDGAQQEEGRLESNSMMHTRSRVLHHRRPHNLNKFICGLPVTLSYASGYEALSYVSICSKCARCV
jgi:hypothetical protein